MPDSGESVTGAPQSAAEQLLRDIFENTIELIQSVNPDGRFLFVNRAWRETLGYTVEEVKQLTIFDVIHPDHHEACTGLMAQIEAGEDVGRFETEFVKKNGVTITVSGSSSTRIENGQPTSTRGFFTDITEQKSLEADRELAYGEMEKALAQVKALAELLPVCSWCKKVRSDAGDWDSLENYLLSHPDIRVTHGICPVCFDGMKGSFDPKVEA
jgi:PAS domain S-box-containing protein